MDWKDKVHIITVAICVLVLISVLVAKIVVASNRVTVEIEKTASGYDVYKNGKLEYEFTRQNTDSMSLETLKMIYECD